MSNGTWKVLRQQPLVSKQRWNEVFAYISPVRFPNGIYRNIFKFFDEDDLNGVTIWAQNEMYDVKNAENIMK